MMSPRVISPGSILDRTTLVQFIRYGLSGGAAAATHLAILVILVELADSPPTLASAVGFACGTLVNYALQHSFVFSQTGGHGSFFPRYLAVTAATMTLNTLLFWSLWSALGIDYLLSQIITIGVIVPINFMINRGYTFNG